MSFVDKSKLKGILDTSLSFDTVTIPFTTAPITIDALQDYNAYIRTFTITNNDAANIVNYIQGSPTGVSKPVPIVSEKEVQGWESFLQITPNAVTGNGYVELELINYFNAIKDEFAKVEKALLVKQSENINQSA